jgi:hypothetical protein
MTVVLDITLSANEIFVWTFGFSEVVLMVPVRISPHLRNAQQQARREDPPTTKDLTLKILNPGYLGIASNNVRFSHNFICKVPVAN